MKRFANLGILMLIILSIIGCLRREKSLAEEIREAISKLKSPDKHYYIGFHVNPWGFEIIAPFSREASEIESYGQKAIPYLMELIYDKDANSLDRCEAVAIIARIGYGEGPLIKAYHKLKDTDNSKDNEVRLSIIKAFVLPHFRLSICDWKIFREAFQDHCGEIRAVAAYYLWRESSDNTPDSFRSKKTLLHLIDSMKMEQMRSDYNSHIRYVIFHYIVNREDWGTIVDYQSAKNWWEKYSNFLFLYKGKFYIDEWAYSKGIPVDWKTGNWLDPKDGHELTQEEIKQIYGSGFHPEPKSEPGPEKTEQPK